MVSKLEVSNLHCRSPPVKRQNSQPQGLGRLGFRFFPTRQDGLPCAFTSLLRCKILGPRLSAFFSKRYRMLIFHAVILYVALGTCQENKLAALALFS